VKLPSNPEVGEAGAGARSSSPSLVMVCRQREAARLLAATQSAGIVKWRDVRCDGEPSFLRSALLASERWRNDWGCWGCCLGKWMKDILIAARNVPTRDTKNRYFSS
jgi:hypothetical protein